jgi:hypothetical protein
MHAKDKEELNLQTPIISAANTYTLEASAVNRSFHNAPESGPPVGCENRVQGLCVTAHDRWTRRRTDG